MNTALRNSITATGKEAQYDACAKRLLGQKYILAHILIKTVEEFHGMHPEDVVPLIEGEPLIRTVPIEPGLTDELPEHDDTYELHRLLGALLSQNLPVEQKLAIIDREYDIPLEHDLRKEVDTMCSLSQGIKEEGIAIGEARGESRGETKIILTMYRNGLSAEQFSAATDKSIEDITSIIEQKDSVPVS